MAESTEGGEQSRNFDPSQLRWAADDLRDFVDQRVGGSDFALVGKAQIEAWQQAVRTILGAIENDLVLGGQLEDIKLENSGLYDRIVQLTEVREAERTSYLAETNTLTNRIIDLEAANAAHESRWEKAHKVFDDFSFAVDEVKTLTPGVIPPWNDAQNAAEKFFAKPKEELTPADETAD